MFESDIERIKLFLTERLASADSHVYLRDIMQDSVLEPAYKIFFDAEFGWWLYEEQMLRRSNPHVDLGDPSIQNLLHNLDSQYRKTARFEREQIASIIDTAVKSILNFRVRPRTTLKWFIFRGEPTKPVYEVVLRFRYFSEYPYIYSGFREWLEAKNLHEESMELISVLEFERLIEKIDTDVILDLSPHQFVELIQPIFAFFTSSPLPRDIETVPIESLIIFLDDKGIQPIAHALERLLYTDGVRFITRNKFLEIVDSIISEIEEEPSTVAYQESSLQDQPTQPHVAAEPEVFEVQEEVASTSLALAEEESVEGESADELLEDEAEKVIAELDVPELTEIEEESAVDWESYPEPSTNSNENLVELYNAHSFSLPKNFIMLNGNEVLSRIMDIEFGVKRELVETAAQSSSDKIVNTVVDAPVFSEIELEDSVEEELASSTDIQEETQSEEEFYEYSDSGEEYSTPLAPSDEIETTADEDILEVDATAEIVEEATEQEVHVEVPSENLKQEEMREEPLQEFTPSDLDAELVQESTDTQSVDAVESALNTETENEAVHAEQEQVESSPVIEDLASSLFAKRNDAEEPNGFVKQDSVVKNALDEMEALAELAASPLPEPQKEEPVADIKGIISKALGNSSDIQNSLNLSVQDTTSTTQQIASVEELLQDVAQEEQDDSPKRPSISTFIQNKQRDVYLRKLFNKNELLYEGLLSKLDRTTRWKEALDVLDKFYAEHGVDPQAATARDLRMAVYKRFVSS